MRIPVHIVFSMLHATPRRTLQEVLNRHVVIDFGHEVLNGIFHPLRFQSGPLDEPEFISRLDESYIPAARVRVMLLGQPSPSRQPR